MIKKMRKRFVLSALLAFALVMAVIISGINIVNYVQTADKQDRMTSMLLRTGEMQPPAPPEKPDAEPKLPGDMREFGREAQFTTRFFTVTLTEDGEIESINADYISEIDEETAEEYAKAVLAKGSETGYYEYFRYRIGESDAGAKVLFLNSETQIQYMKSLALLSVTIGIISLAAVLVLIIIFSGRAIRPFAKNIERQKQFITDAGHELKTPITSIATSADIAAMEHEGDEWIENIQKQTARLSKLTTNLVALSRLDEEQPFPDKAEFSLTEAAWEISEPFPALAKARGKLYSESIEEGLSCYGSREAVQQIISILLDNAVKYSAGKGNISLKVYGKGKNNIIEVSNDCRFDREIDPERLFDRFYRVEDSHSTSTGGTGIGLSMARAIAEAHKGHIEATLTGRDKITFKVTI
jgi:signal transduction histidine kinase